MSVFTPLSSGVALTKQFQEVGLKAYHHAFYYPLRPEFIPQAGKSADFLLWSTLLVDPENNPKHKEFGEKIKKRWNVVVNSDHASAYDGLYNILDSIQRAGSLDPKKIVDALSNLDLKGIMGRYVFEQSNHQIKYGEEFVPVPACQIQEGKRPPSPGPPRGDLLMAKVSGPTPFVVVDSFVVEEDGFPIVYRKGEIVHPDDPYLKSMPGQFRPFEFAHPLKRSPEPPPVEEATAAPGEKRGR